MFVSCECCVLSCRGLWVWLINRLEESYRVLWIQCYGEGLKGRPRSGIGSERHMKKWTTVFMLWLNEGFASESRGRAGSKCVHPHLMLTSFRTKHGMWMVRHCDCQQPRECEGAEEGSAVDWHTDGLSHVIFCFAVYSAFSSWQAVPSRTYESFLWSYYVCCNVFNFAKNCITCRLSRFNLSFTTQRRHVPSTMFYLTAFHK
jgi:hypothetical protein